MENGERRYPEGSDNKSLHLLMEKDIIVRNMKVVYEVGNQIVKDLDSEIAQLRMKLRNL